MRRASICLLVALALGCLVVALGLRLNGTHSLPLGLYLAVGNRAHKGDLVTVNLPALPIFALAKERGYLNVAYSPAPRIMKRIVAVAGDMVSIDADGVTVRGVRLVNSTPLPCDGSGRPLQAFQLKDYVLGPGEVLLMSEYNPASFDARYFGPIQADAIDSVVIPLWTYTTAPSPEDNIPAWLCVDYDESFLFLPPLRN